ncbi:glycosyltransferase [Brachybacterium sp. 107]|uniref:glycosyltransferase n=1 Tax=Brachybacterium sp. 107 TaxID=3457736 RepID=UPI0040346077
MSAAGPLTAHRPERVAVVIPAKNEAERIEATIRAAHEIQGVDLVVVVDDGSTDATSAVAMGADALVVRHKTNRGKAAAMATGAQVVALREDAERADGGAGFSEELHAEPRSPGHTGPLPVIDGQAMTPRALLFLDADMESSVTTAQPLADAVLGEGVDMAIALLPPQAGAGGMGIVVGTARRGILRATGWEATQPLSGTRCITRETWDACQPLAPGWGVETSLTIDALTGGFWVKEIETSLAHRATGKDLRGQLHRAAQLRDVVRALARRRHVLPDDPADESAVDPADEQAVEPAVDTALESSVDPAVDLADEPSVDPAELAADDSPMDEASTGETPEVDPAGADEVDPAGADDVDPTTDPEPDIAAEPAWERRAATERDSGTVQPRPTSVRAVWPGAKRGPEPESAEEVNAWDLDPVPGAAPDEPSAPASEAEPEPEAEQAPFVSSSSAPNSPSSSATISPSAPVSPSAPAPTAASNTAPVPTAPPASTPSTDREPAADLADRRRARLAALPVSGTFSDEETRALGDLDLEALERRLRKLPVAGDFAPDDVVYLAGIDLEALAARLEAAPVQERFSPEHAVIIASHLTVPEPELPSSIRPPLSGDEYASLVVHAAVDAENASDS